MAAEAQTVTGRDYGLGFETLESEISLDSLPVEGSIPEWLAGTLIRNGPAKYEAGEKRFRHWFDGLAMLHRFGFAGGEVSYANRFLRSNAYREAEEGRISYREFATDPCRSIFRRAATMFRPNMTDNCNVNLARLGDEYIAMTETPLPVAFDPETLDALGVAYDVPGLHATAHPHHDRETGELRRLRHPFRAALRVPALRPARPLPSAADRVAPDLGALLHAQLRDDRAPSGPRRLPARRQPGAARPQRPAVHRELPLEAGARDPVPGLRPRQRRAGPDLRGGCLLLLPPHQRLRTRVGDRDRHGLLRGCLDRRLALPRPRPHRPADRLGARPRRSATGSHPIPTRSEAKSSATPRSSCRRSTTASATDAPTGSSTGSAPTPTATRRTSSIS